MTYPRFEMIRGVTNEEGLFTPEYEGEPTHTLLEWTDLHPVDGHDFGVSLLMYGTPCPKDVPEEFQLWGIRACYAYLKENPTGQEAP